MEILEEVYIWVSQHKKWFLRAARFMSGLLMLAATVLSGVAAWYSYRAADKANETATAAYKFTIRSANDSSTLQQPSLNVVSGKIVEGETSDDGPFKMKTTRYSIELHVQNSGARDAAPVWIAIGDDQGSAWSQAQPLATIAKGQDMPVTFEVTVFNTQLKDLRALTVSLRYLDTKPEYQFEQSGDSTKTFKRICSAPKVQVLTMLRPRNESGMTEVALAMGAAITLEDLAKGNWTPELGAATNSLKAMARLNASECEADKPQ